MLVDTPSPTRCAQHPDVETYLRCGRCDTLICPRCLVHTPVGARCRQCAGMRPHPVYQVGPVHLLRGVAAGLGVAIPGGIAVNFAPFAAWIVVPLLGFAVGEVVSHAANRKRGTSLALASAVITLVGLFAGTVLYLALRSPFGLPVGMYAAIMVGSLVGRPFMVLLWAVAAFLAWTRVR